MGPLHILGGWAAGVLVALIWFAVVVKPRNRDGWLVVAGMSAIWPLTLLAIGASYVFEERRDDVG